ncbi:MAG TPA: primosomal protein N', partial [Rhodocyclaceae bacterium]|nr:primosomal protein N' [Rhodocyclaceae bacterium]
MKVGAGGTDSPLSSDDIPIVPIIQVALDVPIPGCFDYRAPDATPEDVGRRVSVPFGTRFKTGIVVAVVYHTQVPAAKLKDVAAILRDMPPLPRSWLELCEFCARYYQAPLGAVTSLALPPMLRRGKLPRLPKKAAQAPEGSHSAAAQTGVVPPLLAEQQQAVDAIDRAVGFNVFLLHGVTGSGKTEVYLRTIETVLARGGQALMLVPEIALTPQLEGRVAARFPQAKIVAANSAVTDAARARGFLHALYGEVDIVLGTRLAVFMPIPRLQLIVVDEEHDASFKQQDGVRYSARDLAIWRAHQLKIPIVLGSATPSLETFFHAGAGEADGRYRRLALQLRAVAKSMPTVRTIDTRREKLREGMSLQLIDGLERCLARGEQSLVFLNRRGYAPVLACTACAWISGCRCCAANLVLHLLDKRLRCHHCGFETPIPRACPDCGNIDLQPFGRGTQRLEAALTEHFPDARIARIDRDSANTPQKWQALLAAVHDGSVDILIGTQMLAKGHDFPRLTLAAVVGADAALFSADFRAPERLFAQLMQVGGRSGRAELPGEVLIQTEHPEHPLYQALLRHDYDHFARQQLDERRIAGFPPFSFQAMLRAEAATMEQSLDFLRHARAAAVALADGAIALYDPVPMRLARLMTLERAQLLIESVHRPALQGFLSRWIGELYALKSP